MELVTDDPGTSVFEDPERNSAGERILQITVTHKEVIIHAFRNYMLGGQQLVGTMAMTAEEWWEYLESHIT